MKHILLASVLCFVLILTARSQCVEKPQDPCVPVNQSILDRASKALDDYAAAKLAIVALEKERGLSDKEREVTKAAFAVYDSAIAVFQKGLADRDKVIELMDKALTAMVQLNDKLLEQMNKKPSAWSKLVKTLTEIAILVAGVALGRGHL